MDLIIKTYLRVRMPSGERREFLSGGKPMVYTQSDYRSVVELREQLTTRNARTHDCEDIDNGIKLTPKPGFSHAYAWQEVTLGE